MAENIFLESGLLSVDQLHRAIVGRPHYILHRFSNDQWDSRLVIAAQCLAATVRCNVKTGCVAIVFFIVMILGFLDSITWAPDQRHSGQAPGMFAFRYANYFSSIVFFILLACCLTAYGVYRMLWRQQDWPAYRQYRDIISSHYSSLTCYKEAHLQLHKALARNVLWDNPEASAEIIKAVAHWFPSEQCDQHYQEDADGETVMSDSPVIDRLRAEANLSDVHAAGACNATVSSRQYFQDFQARAAQSSDGVPLSMRAAPVPTFLAQLSPARMTGDAESRSMTLKDPRFYDVVNGETISAKKSDGGYSRSHD